MDTMTVFWGFAGTLLAVLGSIEAGYLLGKLTHRRSPDENASATSAISSSILGLLAFILAFTFSIVTHRYDARKVLVREEANAIGTAYLRADFLPEADRAKTKVLFREYVSRRLKAGQTRDINIFQDTLTASSRIHQDLWGMAVAHGRKDMNSDIGALYIDALNKMIDFHSSRRAVVQARIPTGIWVVLYILVVLGMFSLGYQTAISGSKRSQIIPVLALAFTIVITLIHSLDSLNSGFIKVSQQPLADLLESISADNSKVPSSK